ncbi:MAG TPA: PEGA domain-containing protein, partial [Candidatus Saccharibacteria bacterium]|nr:PEGA domain-containing protein [Candidatus Saccharibacteria bacterium]
MDYLDPTKKKRKKNQLLIMYILLGIAIGIATLVVVYNVNGYSIDRETGEVVQNGLLYLDAKPGSAEVFLNGEKQRGKTDARLVVAEGTYDVEMRRDGYLPWKRNLVLEGGSLRRLTYARLVPETIESEAVREVDVEPSFMT